MTLQTISHHSSFRMLQFTSPLCAKYARVEQVEKHILVPLSPGGCRKRSRSYFSLADEGKDSGGGGKKGEEFGLCLVCKARHRGKLQQLDMLSVPLLKDLHKARAQRSSLSIV